MNTGSDTLEILETTVDAVREFLIFQLNEPLTKGRTVRLHIGFEGSMANKIVGLYSSSYVKEDETRKWIATSKFEPTYARQAFPCFDEPALKAEFTITLVHPSGEDYHALSNMNVDSSVSQEPSKRSRLQKVFP